jgi:hypothetical protein
VLYSGGSTQLYRKLVVCHYATYCTGAVLSTTSASVLYVSVSISAPFHISAAFVAIVFCLYAAFFTRRIGRTKSGFRGGFEAAELEISSQVSGEVSKSSGEVSQSKDPLEISSEASSEMSGAKDVVKMGGAKDRVKV